MNKKIGVGGALLILLGGLWIPLSNVLKNKSQCVEYEQTLIDKKENKTLDFDEVLILQKIERVGCPGDERSQNTKNRLEGTQNIVFDGINVNYYTPAEYKTRKDELIPMVRTRLNAENNRMDSKEDAYEAIHIATLEAINGNITTLTGKITLKNLVNRLE